MDKEKKVVWYGDEKCALVDTERGVFLGSENMKDLNDALERMTSKHPRYQYMVKVLRKGDEKETYY